MQFTRILAALSAATVVACAPLPAVPNVPQLLAGLQTQATGILAQIDALLPGSGLTVSQLAPVIGDLVSALDVVSSELGNSVSGLTSVLDGILPIDLRKRQAGAAAPILANILSDVSTTMGKAVALGESLPEVGPLVQTVVDALSALATNVDALVPGVLGTALSLVSSTVTTLLNTIGLGSLLTSVVGSTGLSL